MLYFNLKYNTVLIKKDIAIRYKRLKGNRLNDVAVQPEFL